MKPPVAVTIPETSTEALISRLDSNVEIPVTLRLSNVGVSEKVTVATPAVPPADIA